MRINLGGTFRRMARAFQPCELWRRVGRAGASGARPLDPGGIAVHVDGLVGTRDEEHGDLTDLPGRSAGRLVWPSRPGSSRGQKHQTRGWQWQHTRMSEAERERRLWLAIAVATCGCCVSAGKRIKRLGPASSVAGVRP